MVETSLDAFKGKYTRLVADWLKSKGLHKLCSVFEGNQEPFVLSLACKSVYIHSFQGIIEATEKFPGGWGHLIIWNGPIMGHLNSFSASGGGNLNQNFPKIQMPRGFPRGDV